jgi:prevent-host-death family protein
MKTVLISEFKAKCIALLKEVDATREPLLITVRGKPLARVEPSASARGTRLPGDSKDKARIRGELVRTDFEWESLKK